MSRNKNIILEDGGYYWIDITWPPIKENSIFIGKYYKTYNSFVVVGNDVLYPAKHCDILSDIILRETSDGN